MSRTAKYLAWPFAAMACVYLAACGWLYLEQDSYLYFPPPRQAADTTPVMHLDRPDADLLVSTRLRTGPRAVLYFGGNAEDVARSVPLLANAFPDAAIYALHYRSYGGSTGRPTERGLVGDGVALFDVIQRGHEEVTVIGRSLGTGVAIQVASQRPATRLVLVTAYDSIARLAARNFPYVPVKLLLRDQYDSCRYAPRVSVPTTLIVAGRDQVIPRSSTQHLLTCFNPGVARLRVLADAGHDDISRQDGYIPALRNTDPTRPQSP